MQTKQNYSQFSFKFVRVDFETSRKYWVAIWTEKVERSRVYKKIEMIIFCCFIFPDYGTLDIHEGLYTFCLTNRSKGTVDECKFVFGGKTFNLFIYLFNEFYTSIKRVSLEIKGQQISSPFQCCLLTVLVVMHESLASTVTEICHFRGSNSEVRASIFSRGVAEEL